MGVEPAASWSQERPPDLHGDFHGDRDRWNVARDVWYVATTGKQLPASGAADRESQWTKALNARSKRRKRAAESGPEGVEVRSDAMWLISVLLMSHIHS